MTTKRIVTVGNDGRERVLVVFRLDGDRAVAEWRPGSELLRPSIENWGVTTAEGNIPMSDGRRFLEALPLAFANSTQLAVVDGAA